MLLKSFSLTVTTRVDHGTGYPAGSRDGTRDGTGRDEIFEKRDGTGRDEIFEKRDPVKI